jgi:hypothetical protein
VLLSWIRLMMLWIRNRNTLWSLFPGCSVYSSTSVPIAAPYSSAGVASVV